MSSSYHLTLTIAHGDGSSTNWIWEVSADQALALTFPLGRAQIEQQMSAEQVAAAGAAALETELTFRKGHEPGD